MSRSEVMERLGISKNKLDHIVSRTAFRKRTRYLGCGYHYEYTEKDVADIARYLKALKEWKIAKEFRLKLEAPLVKE